MKRKLFFWLDRLKITHAERLAISVLLSLLILCSVIAMFIPEGSAASPEEYQAILESFEHRTQQTKEERQKLLKRYNSPPQTTPVQESMYAVTRDTLPGSPNPDIPHVDTTSQDTASSSLVNINSATHEQLQTLPGIGPVYARRIIQYRNNDGQFRTAEELKKIKGIGEKRLEKIKPLIEI